MISKDKELGRKNISMGRDARNKLSVSGCPPAPVLYAMPSQSMALLALLIDRQPKLKGRKKENKQENATLLTLVTHPSPLCSHP